MRRRDANWRIGECRLTEHWRGFTLVSRFRMDWERTHNTNPMNLTASFVRFGRLERLAKSLSIRKFAILFWCVASFSTLFMPGASARADALDNWTASPVSTNGVSGGGGGIMVA